MYFNSTILTDILLFVGVYYLFLFIVALHVKDVQQGSDYSYFYFVIIPAKNEEKVIKNTINACLRFRGDSYRIVVVDDNSNDSTPLIVNSICKSNPKVVLLNNISNQRKRGKGSVLNYAFRQISFAISQNFMEPFNLKNSFTDSFDKEHIIIGVFDADAVPSENMLCKISSVFSNLKVDAIQTAVRISNRNQSLLAKMQDIEFLGFSRIIQKARSKFGSVGLGGNGQFSRLSSLEKIDIEPWGSTLTEDFELGLRMISEGMRLHFTDEAIVEQEGVISLRAILKQRTRWLQGHFTNWKYIPSIIKSDTPLITKIDTLIYIVFVSVVFLVGLSLMLSVLSILRVIVVENKMLEVFYNKNYILGLIALTAYSFAFIPMFIYSVFKFYKDRNFFYKVFYVFLFAAYTYIWLPAGVAALYRLLTKRTEWLKTTRVAITTPSSAYAIEGAGFRNERRRVPRFVFHTYSFANQSPCFIINLSTLGAKIIMPDKNQINDQSTLSLDIPLFGSKQAKIVWQKESRGLITARLEFVSSNEKITEPVR